jgi:hypothetical protein
MRAQRTFAHADQPVARAPVRTGGRAETVVGALELDRVRAVAHHHRRTAGSGVLEGVGESLLGDPVDREVERGRDGRPLALVVHGHVEAGRAHLGGEGIEIVDAALGRQVGGGGRAQHGHDPAQLGERVPARAFHCLQRSGGPLRIALHHPAGSRRLDRHDAHAVRDHVVDVARQPLALGGCGRELLLPFELQLDHAPFRGDRGGLGGAQAVREDPDHQRREDVGRAPREVTQRREVQLVPHHDPTRGDECRGDPHAPPELEGDHGDRNRQQGQHRIPGRGEDPQQHRHHEHRECQGEHPGPLTERSHGPKVPSRQARAHGVQRALRAAAVSSRRRRAIIAAGDTARGESWGMRCTLSTVDMDGRPGLRLEDDSRVRPP